MQQVPGIQINIADYEARKASGNTKIVKLNGRVYFTQQKFDEATGVAVPVLVQIEKQQLVGSLENLKKNVAALEMVLADIDSAKEVLAV